MKDAALEEPAIQSWWRRWPAANVGVITGVRSGIVVLDVDPRNGGDESLATLESKYGPLPSTVEALTGGGGRHFVFSSSDGRLRKRSDFLPGLDFLAEGAYFVAAPSLHASGARYAWREGSAPGGRAPVPPPMWLCRLLEGNRSEQHLPSPALRPREPAAAYAEAALKAEVETVWAAREGQRNNTLNKASFALGQLCAGGQLEPRSVEYELLGAAIASGLSEQDALPTIRSGLRAGQEHPRHPTSKHVATSVQRPLREPTSQEVDSYILIPGQHTNDLGQRVEVGNDDFAAEVLKGLPPEALYRWDQVVGELVGRHGHVRFKETQLARARLLVDESVRLSRWTQRGRNKEASPDFVACSEDHARLVLAAASYAPGIRQLQLITHLPVLGPDWVRVKPGWNPSSGIYYDEPPDLVGLKPRRSNHAEVLRVLDDLLIDFPFRDAASRQNFLGLLLTPFLVRAITGCIPMHLVMSPLERTGKGLLINSMLGIGILGESIPVFQVGRTEEEREKRITSLILESAGVVHLDNIPTSVTLDSPALCSLLTTRTWKGRELSRSRAPQLPNNLILVASGNNIRATGEVAKRCVPINLQPRDDHPEERSDFKHPDITAYARASRRSLLAMILGMLEVWKDEGQPACDVRLGGFEEWTRTVGGVLQIFGFDQWLSNYRDWITVADDWTSDAYAFAQLWWSRFQGGPVRAIESLSLLEGTSLFPSVTSRAQSGHLMALTKGVLIPMVDRPVREFQLHQQKSGRNTHYRLCRDESRNS